MKNITTHHQYATHSEKKSQQPYRQAYRDRMMNRTVTTLLFIYLNTGERTEETQFTVNLAIRCIVSLFIG